MFVVEARLMRARPVFKICTAPDVNDSRKTCDGKAPLPAGMVAEVVLIAQPIMVGAPDGVACIMPSTSQSPAVNESVPTFTPTLVVRATLLVIANDNTSPTTPAAALSLVAVPLRLMTPVGVSPASST